MTLDPPVDLRLLFEKHGVFVEGLARALVHEEHTAEDLAHETWLAVVHRPPVGVRNIRAWLSTILERRVAAHRRRSRNTLAIETVELADRAATAEEAAQQLEYVDRLQAAVRALAEPYRSTVTLRFYQGLRPGIIAARLGVPVKTVKTRLSRGLEQLRTALDRQDSRLADPPRDSRPALAAFCGSRVSATRRFPSIASVIQGSALSPLFLGMNKLIVAAAALLLAVGIYSRYSTTGVAKGIPSIGAAGDRAPANLEHAETELTRPAGSSPARSEVAEGTPAPLATGPAASSSVTVTVEVLDISGIPVEGRSILLQASSWLNAGQPTRLRRTDPSGRVVFAGLEPSDYLVSDAHGATEDSLELEPGETKALHWTIMGDVVVRGQVRDAQGRPVPHADIWCAASTEKGKAVWPVATAGPDGRYTARCSPQAGLQATATGHLPSPLYPLETLREIEPGVRELVLAVDTRGGSLTGRVIDTDGQPVPGAQVVVEALHPLSVVTEDRGRFEYPGDLPAGDHPVVVRADGFAPNVTSVRMEDESIEVEFLLHRGVEIFGTVLSPDGSPASKAHVWTADPESGWQKYGHGQGSTTRTDEQGRFTLRQVAPGRVALRAQAGWADATSRAESLLEVTESHGQEGSLQLQFGRTITGRVVDRDGLLVSGVVVTGFCGSMRSKDARTGADGHFRLTALPEPEEGLDEWELVARSWTGTSVRELGRLSRVELNGAIAELVIDRIEKASATIVGRIEGESSPIPGDVTATLVHQSGRRGSPLSFDPQTGAFEKGPLQPGTYRLELQRGGDSVGTKSGLTVGVGDTLDAGVVRIDEGGSVEIRPQPRALPSKAPEQLNASLQEAEVHLVGPGLQQVVLEWGNGSWRNRGVLEPGTWRLQVLADDFVVPDQDITVKSGEVTPTLLALSPGKRVVLEINLPAEASWSELRVRMHDSSNRLLYDSGVLIRASLERADGITLERTLPLGVARVLVSTDTSIGTEEDVSIPPLDSLTRTVQLVAD